MNAPDPQSPSPLMTPAEVAYLFHVDAKTVTRWAREGKLRFRRTLGVTGPGHRRYFRAQVEAMVAGKPLTEEQLDAMVRGEL